MKTLKKIALGLFAAAVAFCAFEAAIAQVPYQGYNAAPTAAAGGGVYGLPGVIAPTNGNTTVTPVASGTNCSTTVTVVAGSIFQLATTSTTATVCTLTFPYAMPHGYICLFNDLTTNTGITQQASMTTTSCTSKSATTGASDVVTVVVFGY